MQKKIKICFVISNVRIGGAERQFINLLNNLNSDIFDIHLLIFSYNGEIPFKVNQNINIIKNSEINNIKNKFFKIFNSVKYLHNHFKNKNYSIIQTTLFINSVIVRFSLPKKYNNRAIATIRTTSYRWWQYLFEYYFIRKYLLITNSKTVFDKLFKFRIFKKNLHYIPNGFKMDHNKLSIKNSNKKIRIGTVGRFSFEKNQILLLRALKTIDKKNISISLYGRKGPSYDTIVEYIEKNNLKKNVKIFLYESNLKKIYSGLDIIVLPSLYEGFPNVLYEAILFKKICLISNLANKDMHIKDKVNGFVFKNNPNDLSNVINFAIKNKDTDLMIDIKNYAYKEVKNRFSLDKICKQYEKIYLSIGH